MQKLYILNHTQNKFRNIFIRYNDTETNVSLMTVETLKLEPICTDSPSFNIYLQFSFITLRVEKNNTELLE